MAILDEKTSLLKEKDENSPDTVESKSNTVDC